MEQSQPVGILHRNNIKVFSISFRTDESVVNEGTFGFRTILLFCCMIKVQ